MAMLTTVTLGHQDLTSLPLQHQLGWRRADSGRWQWRCPAQLCHHPPPVAPSTLQGWLGAPGLSPGRGQGAGGRGWVPKTAQLLTEADVLPT